MDRTSPKLEFTRILFSAGKVASTRCASLMSPLPLTILPSNERMPACALGFFPHPQLEESIGEICRDRGVARILFERSFELVQTTFPLPLPAMDVTRILQRSGRVRLQL